MYVKMRRLEVECHSVQYGKMERPFSVAELFLSVSVCVLCVMLCVVLCVVFVCSDSRRLQHAEVAERQVARHGGQRVALGQGVEGQSPEGPQAAGHRRVLERGLQLVVVDPQGGEGHGDGGRVVLSGGHAGDGLLAFEHGEAGLLRRPQGKLLVLRGVRLWL